MTGSEAKTPGLRAGRGRPTARNPLSYVVNIRLTEADGRRMDEAAERENRDRADLAREILLTGLNKLVIKS
jgi:hypothetical protein